jgi:hypothetical protein
MSYVKIRTIICPECNNKIQEFTKFDERGFIVENHAFCADSGGGSCLYGGAWPDNSRNIRNNKIREQRQIKE